MALSVAKVARVLDDLEHAFGVALVERWHDRYTQVALPGSVTGGYTWYASEASDAIAVHNTSGLIAMASQLLFESGGRRTWTSSHWSRCSRHESP